MEFIRTTSFTKATQKLGVTEAELEALEAEIATNPQAGDVIQGLKGVRKIRFGYGGKGKRALRLSGVDAGRRGLSAACLRQVETDGPLAKTAQGHSGIC